MYMCIAAGQGQTTPGDKILMSTETSCHFSHLLQVSKQSLWSLILYNFFNDFIHVYSPKGRGWQPLGDEIVMPTGTSCHFRHLLQVSKRSFWCLILYTSFFHHFIHVYSPRQGQTAPQETKFWCQQKCLVTSFISSKSQKLLLKSDFI